MDRYKVLAEIGTGTYGKVLRARRRVDGLVVAVKALKKAEAALSWEGILRTREVEALKQLQHPSIIRLIEVIREEGGRIFLVMEHAAHGDLLGWLKRRQQQAPPVALPSPATVRTIMRPLLAALAYLHARGYCHRDVKPENILLAEGGPPGRDADFPYTLKLADFGLARRAAGTEEAPAPFTPYVSTRWYRAPEILLRAAAQTAAVDVWAAGCLMVEVFSLQPLLPGDSQLDQITKTAALLGGAPTHATWPAGAQLVQQLKLRLPQPFPGAAPPLLRALPPHAPPEATDLLYRMLAYDPARRISAEGALRHAFVTGGATYASSVSSASSSVSASSPLEAEEEEVIEGEEEDGAHDLSVLMGEAGADTSVLMADSGGQDSEDGEEEEESDEEDDHDVLTLLASSQPSSSFVTAAASLATAESGEEEEEDHGGVIDEEAQEQSAARSPPLSSPTTGSYDASPSPSLSPSPQDPDVNEEQEEEGDSDGDVEYDDEPSPPFAAGPPPPPRRLGPLHGLTLRAPSFSPPWKQLQQHQQPQPLLPLPPPPSHSHLPFPIASHAPLASLPRAPRPQPPPAAQPPPSGAWTTPAASLFSAEGGVGRSSRSAVTTSSSNSSGESSGGGGDGRGRNKGSFLGRVKGLDGLKHPLFLSPSPPQRKKKANRRGSPGFWPK